jgi:hypothetical protein
MTHQHAPPVKREEPFHKGAIMQRSLIFSFAAGMFVLGTSMHALGQSSTSGTSTTESSGFAAGRHADGGTGVRKAQSATTASTGGTSGGSSVTSDQSGNLSSSTAGTGGSATAGSGVSASSVGTGGSSAKTEGNSGSNATSASGPGASAKATGPSGTSTSDSSGSSADPAPGASGYARDHQGDAGGHHGTPPGQSKKQQGSKSRKEE